MVEQNELWHKVEMDLTSDYLNETMPNPELINPVTKYLRENFKIGEYSEMRKAHGYYSVLVGYAFKNKEDAVRFRLAMDSP